jgi:hypothetical protein
MADPTGTPTGPITRVLEGLGAGKGKFPARAHFVPITDANEPSDRTEAATNSAEPEHAGRRPEDPAA